MAESQTAELRDRALGYLGDWRWRLNNLYWITDKEGRRVQFKMNWAQEELFDYMHYMQVILKARQLGMTTFITLAVAGITVTIQAFIDDRKSVRR